MSFVDETVPKRSRRERNGVSLAGLEPVARPERAAGPPAVAVPGLLAGPPSGDSGRSAGAEGGRVE